MVHSRRRQTESVSLSNFAYASVSCAQDLRTPLHITALFGFVDIATALLKKGALVEAQDKDGQTPLHLACRGGHVPMIALLVDHGANIEAQFRVWREDRAGGLRCAGHHGLSDSSWLTSAEFIERYWMRRAIFPPRVLF